MPPEPNTDSPKPFRDTGELLGFADELRKNGDWPLERPTVSDRVPTATPYLVIPANAFDTGARPLAAGMQSAGIEILDAAGAPVNTPIAGQTYRLSATVHNLGATASYAGLADFFVASRAVFKIARGGGQTPPAQGRTGFSVRSNASTVFESPALWTPANAAEAGQSVLVQVADLLLDPLGWAFDWFGNRHVALR